MAWYHAALTAGCCTLLWAKQGHGMISCCTSFFYSPLCKTGEQTVGWQAGRGAQTTRGLRHDASRRRRGGRGDRSGACHRGARRRLWRRYAVDRRHISTANKKTIKPNCVCWSHLLTRPPGQSCCVRNTDTEAQSLICCSFSKWLTVRTRTTFSHTSSVDVVVLKHLTSSVHETWFQVIENIVRLRSYCL